MTGGEITKTSKCPIRESRSYDGDDESLANQLLPLFESATMTKLKFFILLLIYLLGITLAGIVVFRIIVGRAPWE